MRMLWQARFLALLFYSVGVFATTCPDGASKTTFINRLFADARERLNIFEQILFPKSKKFPWEYAKPLKLGDKFIGETDPVFASNVFHTKIRKGVKYFSEQERANLRLTPGKDGKLYDAFGKLFDTSDAYGINTFGKFLKGSKRRAILVIDKDGSIYAYKYHRVGRIHHSSLVAGGDIAFAGEIEVSDGVIVAINNSSGHYHTPSTNFDSTILYLNNLLGKNAVTVDKIKRVE